MNRITSTTATRSMLADLNTANRALIRAQERISSQKELSRASDEPARALAALSHRAALRRSAQFQRNASDASSWMVAADSALSTSVGELNHVRTLAISARSGASDPNALKAIAAEIRTVRDSVLSLANTQHLGRPIFSGTSDAATAFDPAGVYLGDEGTISRNVAPSVSIDVNRTGTTVFGTESPVALDGNVFQMLSALADAVEAGDLATMGTGIERIDTAVDRLETSQVEIGARARQIDDVTARATSSDIDRRAALSEVEDVDIAQAMIDMSATKFGYDAALAASAKVMQTSLLDFLR